MTLAAAAVALDDPAGTQLLRLPADNLPISSQYRDEVYSVQVGSEPPRQEDYSVTAYYKLYAMEGAEINATVTSTEPVMLTLHDGEFSSGSGNVLPLHLVKSAHPYGPVGSTSIFDTPPPVPAQLTHTFIRGGVYYLGVVGWPGSISGRGLQGTKMAKGRLTVSTSIPCLVDGARWVEPPAKSLSTVGGDLPATYVVKLATPGHITVTADKATKTSDAQLVRVAIFNRDAEVIAQGILDTSINAYGAGNFLTARVDGLGGEYVGSPADLTCFVVAYDSDGDTYGNRFSTNSDGVGGIDILSLTDGLSTLRIETSSTEPTPVSWDQTDPDAGTGTGTVTQDHIRDDFISTSRALHDSVPNITPAGYTGTWVTTSSPGEDVGSWSPKQGWVVDPSGAARHYVFPW